MTPPEPFQLIANWKLNLGVPEAVALAEEFRAHLKADSAVSFSVAPSPLSFVSVAHVLAGSPISVGSQNVCWAASGAFTGEISPAEVVQSGGRFALVGHSERRHLCGETSELIARRAKGALDGGLLAVVCIGETEAEREGGAAARVLDDQIGALGILRDISSERIMLAYEPVWAIGTGNVATPAEIGEMVRIIDRLWTERIGSACPIILYGGSVTSDSIGGIAEIPGIGGALVGGASLTLAKFSALAAVAAASRN